MFNIIKKLVPYQLKVKLVQYLRTKLPDISVEAQRAKLSKHWEKIESEIPRIDIESKHIQHLKMLTTREEMLTLLPKNCTVAELGVNRGDFSKKILDTCQPQKFHIIDVWSSDRYHRGLQKIVEERFEKEISSGQIEINLGYSTDVVNQFQDSYFDWIYIDTDHSYEVTRDELEKYRNKIKPGGIIAGHDFIVGYWRDMVRYGVIEAVYEFCVKYDWEILYLSMEINEHPSFAIRRIQ
ncbi:MAG: class I SAM-dependent methyltransferase [Bacteroidota bacterium]|nr:class I SAM-dependent methyltransferase [Bacteroidota bacterium]